MATHPGCYAVIELGDAVSDTSGSGINLRGLNFAVVMAEEEAPITERFSTWGMSAESSTLYQSLDNVNQMIIGSNGKIYVLTEDTYHDDGIPIKMVFQSGPLPEPNEDVPAQQLKRLHGVYWQIANDPPSTGYIVTLTVFDTDNPTHRAVRSFTQYSRKVLVPISIQARQWKVRIEVTVDSDYAPLGVGMNYQILNRPYTGKTF